MKKQSPINNALIAAPRTVQADAQRAGLDKLTERDINAEVAASRKERARNSKQTVR